MKAEAQRSSLERPTFLYLAVALLLLGGASGCSPKIGDDCTTSTNCSLNGDRLCDITQPGGYCTVFNCEPNGCPSEAVCVAFNETTCAEPAVSNRFRRTFCMKSCESDDDCRGAPYKCVDTSQEPGRQVVDINPSTRRICAVPSASAPSLEPDASTPVSSGEPAVCYPSDASFDTRRPEAGPGPSDGRQDSSDAAEATTTDAADASDDARDGRDAPSDRADTSFVDTPVDTADTNQPETRVDVDAAEDTAVDGEAGPVDASIDAPVDVTVEAGPTLDGGADAPGETGD